MKIDRVQVESFRGLISESFPLQRLTVFHGEMGSGKTSRLLAILYGLTGSTPRGLNLDDLAHIESDHMWVKLEGEHDGRPFFIERRKRKGSPSSSKSDLPQPLQISESIFIEGRRIAETFQGSPSEKILRIDALLGISDLSEAAGSITTAPAEKAAKELIDERSRLKEQEDLQARLDETRRDLARVEDRLSKVDGDLASLKTDSDWFESVKGKIDESKRLKLERDGKRKLLAELQSQLKSIPEARAPQEELNELEKRHSAMKTRITYLEGAMQMLDTEDTKIEEMQICPLCGALISPDGREKLRHIDEEYRQVVVRVMELEGILTEMKDKVESARMNFERRGILSSQIARLESDLAGSEAAGLSAEELDRAEKIGKAVDPLRNERASLETERRILSSQIGTIESVMKGMKEASPRGIDRKIDGLTALRDRLVRVKQALLDALNEERVEQVGRIKGSFKEAFRRIYPYSRIEDVDFVASTIRGKETLQVRARSGGGWLSSAQMSTGENVAMSFALLFTVSQLESSPIILLDEPEEGLDDNGVKGLAEVLTGLKEITQVVVATRSQQLAELLSGQGRT